MIIEWMKKEEAPAVTQMLGCIQEEVFPGNPVRPVSEGKLLEGEDAHRFFVARKQGKIIGCGAICTLRDRKGECCLFPVAVAPEHRGCGVGRRIVETLEREALVLSAKRIAALTTQTGAGFYSKLGYVSGDDGAGTDRGFLLRMEKPLSAGEAGKVLETILQRRSFRGTYVNAPVPREHLKAIMEAGLAAPSGCNRQTTSLIAVDDGEILSRIREVIDPPVCETAPAMICVLTRRINAYRDRCFAVQDYSAAIENMLLAITALGYQSCWYEGHITDADRIADRIARILGVPGKVELVCILPVGIAEEVPRAPHKQAFSQRAWFNGFLRNDGEN